MAGGGSRRRLVVPLRAAPERAGNAAVNQVLFQLTPLRGLRYWLQRMALGVVHV